MSLVCHRRNWVENISGTNINRLRKSILTKTCSSFFDFKKSEGKSFPNVIEQENKVIEEKSHNEYRNISLIAIVISIISLIIGILK